MSRRCAIAVSIAALVLAGCGGDDSDSPEDDADQGSTEADVVDPDESDEAEDEADDGGDDDQSGD